jgi:rubrerythrin
MAGEQVAELPEPLREWVEARAAETGRTPTEVLARAAAAYRLLDQHEDLLPDPTQPPSDGAVPAESLEKRVAALEDDLDEKIDDVRQRVIQVKRETDEKALAEHDHPELQAELQAELDAIESRADDAVTTAEEALAEMEGVRGEFDELDEAVQGGFDNYEDILRNLKDAADDARSRTNRLASALADLGDRVAKLEARERIREEVAELKREANEKGVPKANCESCGSTIQIGLLSKPRCPHCEAPYDGVDTDTGFFKAAALRVADRPALEEGTDDESGAASRSRTNLDLTGEQ